MLHQCTLDLDRHTLFMKRYYTVALYVVLGVGRLWIKHVALTLKHWCGMMLMVRDVRRDLTPMGY